MSLYRRANSSHYWVRFMVNGREVRLSSGTDNRQRAEEFETTARAQAWRQVKLGDKPPYPWADASKRWLAETRKQSTKDAAVLSWLGDRLNGSDVQEINREVIEGLRALKAEQSSQATADRHMAILRAVLKKCVDDWQVLDSMPKVPMYGAKSGEPRWITKKQFAQLCKELPEHLRLAAQFAVLTGLRMRSMLSLTWDRVDLKQRRAWIPGEQMKAGRSHGLPLSLGAVAVLKQLRKLSPDGEHVFQWKGKPIDDCNTVAFQKAVQRSGLGHLRWHDLRHTFASWAVQGGVTMQELMQLGGWSSYSMVLRYGHLAPGHLAAAAEKISHTFRHT